MYVTESGMFLKYKFKYSRINEKENRKPTTFFVANNLASNTHVNIASNVKSISYFMN